jgi:hypothetical protein
MNHIRSLVVLALAALVRAQSAPGFPIQVDTNLRADFQDTSTSVSPAGVMLNRDGESFPFTPAAKRQESQAARSPY